VRRLQKLNYSGVANNATRDEITMGDQINLPIDVCDEKEVQ
jgi:hypothetical protein